MTNRKQHLSPNSEAVGTNPAERGATAIALSIERREWERIALLLLIAAARVIAAAPPGTIDDVLAAFDAGEEHDA